MRARIQIEALFLTISSPLLRVILPSPALFLIGIVVPWQIPPPGICHDYAELYEKDLGKETESIEQGMKQFSPDSSWRKVESKYVELSGKNTGD